jgi:hypothetical protein
MRVGAAYTALGGIGPVHAALYLDKRVVVASFVRVVLEAQLPAR